MTTFHIRARRGLKASLPSEGKLGELFLCTDTGELFAGNGTGHALTQIGGADNDSGKADVTYVDAQDAATLASANSHSDAAVASEANTRYSEDANTLTTAETYTDSAVSGEATARSNAVSSEASTRAGGDASTLATAEAYTDAAISNLPVAPSRRTVSKTTASLASLAKEVSTVTLAKSFVLVQVTVDYPARVELYATAAKQAADAGRPNTTQPAAGTAHGVITDMYLTSAQTFDLSPPAPGANCESTPSADITYCITNLDTVDRAITVTYVFDILEA
jgi:hypothetical protein